MTQTNLQPPAALNLDNSNITSSTSNQGDAGNIRIQDAETVRLNNASSITTAVSTATATGNGGDIEIDTDQLRLNNDSDISSSISGTGNTGSINITAADGINLRNNSSISNRVEAGATGNSRRIRLNTPNLSLRDESAITAATNGNGQAGDIAIAANRISLSNSNISTEIQRNAIVPSPTTNRSAHNRNDRQDNSIVAPNNANRTRDNANRTGNIALETQSLHLDDSSQITASTNGRGRAGNVTVTNADQISLDDNSSISSAVNRRGQRQGGNVRLETDALNLDNSRINTSTNGQGRAGNITVTANQLTATNGGQLTSATNRRRNAGNITLRDLDNLTLSGSNSRISANTNRSGDGGSINLNTQTLNLNDGATISSASQRQGQAGNIRIIAVEQLQSAGGSIRTNATRTAGGNIQITGGDIDLRQGSNIRTDVERGSGNGGDITINADAVRQQDDSDIQTRVGRGTGDGGNISVTADSVIAFDDSDIITESPQTGGDILLDTPVFFGAGYLPDSSDGSSAGNADGNTDGNGRVDLDASGSVSAGNVQTPDTSFIQNSLANLPSSAIDTETLLANSCIARSENGGTFLITGRGGLPPNRPGSAPLSPYPTDTVRSATDSDWQPGEPIVEPQAVYRLPNGELVLMHECR